MFYRFIEDCDGFIYTSSDAYEPEAINATRQWLRESGNRPLYAIGPILPPGVGLLPSNITSSLGTEMPESEDCTPFNEFMNRILNTYGRNSLIYVSCPSSTTHPFTVFFVQISFGSMWWPRGEYVKALVEVLLKHRIPFVHPSVCSAVSFADDNNPDRFSQPPLHLLTCPRNW
jgi:hypothetical protein